VVVLFNAITQSRAEFTGMAFRAAGDIIVGGTMAGADGDVSMAPLPGGFYFYLSGLGVFYPNHHPTRRVGSCLMFSSRLRLLGFRPAATKSSTRPSA